MFISTYNTDKNETMNLENKVYIVTGGSSGIGKACAQLLIEKGAKVAITGRNEHKVKSAAKQVGGALGIAADVSTDEDVEKTFELVINHFGKIDGLINNAGIGFFAPIHETKRTDFEQIFQTNVFGAAMMGAKAAQIFMEQKHGDIVNIASSAGVKGFARGSVYAASKFALRALTQCWQAELRPYNVRVFGVNPSEVTTAFAQEDRVERNEVENKLRPIEIAHTIVSALEMDNRGFIPELSVWATNPF